ATTWQQAIVSLVEQLGELRGAGKATVVGSAFHANEDNGLLARLLPILGGGKAHFRSARAEDEDVLPGFTRLARRRDLAANVRGLEAFGFERVGNDEATGGLDQAAKSKVLVVLGDELHDQDESFGADATLFIYLGE